MIGREQARAVVLAALLVVSTFSMVGVGAAHDGHGAQTFHVTQDGQCYEVSALGDGTQPVEEFYDYRKPSNSEKYNYTYSSHGTTDLQKNQASNVFVYHGSEGYSIVLLHDKLDVEEENGTYGSTITFEFSNMNDVTWQVRDDNYSFEDSDGNHHENDDNWTIDGSNHKVDWMWADHRTDGGAFSGFGDSEITITPYFNESAPNWGETEETGNEAAMDEWRLLDEDGSTAKSLDMGKQLTIAKGSCLDATSPEAALDASPSSIANDEEVVLDASGSSDDGEIVSYKWDFNGDGTVDETTEESSTTHSYDEPDEYTVELTVTDDDGESDTATETVTVWDSSAEGSIEYLNESAVEVEGEFEEVWIREVWHNEAGLASETFVLENTSGTTTFSTFHEGMNGSAITSASAHKYAGGEADIHKENPYDYDIRPETVNLSVADVNETGDGVYDVTFAYENPNDDRMLAHESTFTSGNVDGDAPIRFYPGENTTTVTWTPAANDERVTLDVDLSNFDLNNESASTEAASEYGGVGEGGDDGDDSDDGDDGNDGDDSPKEGAPSAKLSLTDETVDFSDKFGLDASAATDDGEIVKYKWKFGNGVERTTPDEATDKNNDAHTIWHEVYRIYDEPGTYPVSVTVVDDDGKTDTATKKLTVEQNDHDDPTAKLDVPPEATVGEEVTLKATDFSEDPDNLAHVCWVVVGEKHDKPEGATATHTFDKTGEHTVQLHLVDKAGNINELETTIDVTKADDSKGDDPKGDDPKSDDPKDGDDPKDDDPKSDDPKSDDPPKDGIEDDPNEGNTGGGVPSASPPSDDSNDDDDETPKKAAFDGSEGTYGEIVLQSDATDATVEVAESVPGEARQPTAALDGFEALAYAVVSGDESVDATFTVSKDRLESADASADAVSLFRYDDGEWTAVETELLNETDDAFEFGADATNGTYAIGVGAPATAVEDLRLADDRVGPGDDVTVTVTVANDGHASGTQDVTLTVDGETVAAESVSVEADSTAEVEFTHSFDAPGVYSVNAGDASAEVVVEGIETTDAETTTELGTTTASETGDDGGADVPGFGVGAALVALAAAALLARRRV